MMLTFKVACIIMILANCSLGFTLQRRTIGSALQRRTANVNIAKCPKNIKDPFKEIDIEFQHAEDMLRDAETHFSANEGWSKTFFDQQELHDKRVSKIKSRFKIMRKLASDDRGSPSISVACAKRCDGKTTAFTRFTMFGETMYLCPLWWRLETTQMRRDQSKQRDLTMDEVRDTRARVLAHELAHSKKVEPVGYIRDIAYGVQNAQLLAKGQLKNKEGKTLASSLASQNADSYALVAAGMYFATECHANRHALYLFKPGTPPPQQNPEVTDEDEGSVGNEE